MYLQKKIRLLLLAVLLLSIMVPAAVWGDSASESVIGRGGTVTTLEELNQALGGSHTVVGDQLKLEEDVTLGANINVDLGKPMTLNLNGKKIVFKKNPDWSDPESRDIMFYLKSNMVIEGNGTLDSDRSAAPIFHLYKSTLTVNNGTLKTSKPGSVLIQVDGKSEAAASEIIINGGLLKAPSYAIQTRDGGAVKLEINGGTIGGMIILDASCSFPDNDWDNSVPGDKHIININGGKLQYLYSEQSVITMKGGTVSTYLIAVRDSDFYLQGGTVLGQGVDVGGSKFVMTGGKIQSSGSFGLHLSQTQGEISGGTIITTRKTAKGVDCFDKASVKITGGVIKSTAKGNTSSGIHTYGVRNNPVKVTLGSTEGKATYIKGYKYGILQKGPSTVTVAKNTKVFTPKGGKSAYTAGSKLPKSIRGDMSVKYVN